MRRKEKITWTTTTMDQVKNFSATRSANGKPNANACELLSSRSVLCHRKQSWNEALQFNAKRNLGTKLDISVKDKEERCAFHIVLTATFLVCHIKFRYLNGRGRVVKNRKKLSQKPQTYFHIITFIPTVAKIPTRYNTCTNMQKLFLLLILCLTQASAKKSARGPRGRRDVEENRNRRLKKHKKLSFGIPGLVEVSYSTPGPKRGCLGEETELYSCLQGEYVKARDVNVGDSLRTMTNDGPVCSDVYYKYQHPGKSSALAFTVEGSDEAIVFSDYHILYKGEIFGEHQALHARNVQVGDKLVTKYGPSKEVLSIEETNIRLVNILAFNPSLELENGVIISAHSYDETLYSFLFAPFRIMYYVVGGPRMEGFFESKDAGDMLVRLDYYTAYFMNLFSS